MEDGFVCFFLKMRPTFRILKIVLSVSEPGRSYFLQYELLVFIWQIFCSDILTV